MDEDLKKDDDMDDLEAQLSSLGIFGDDDSSADPFASLGLDDGDSSADPFASLGLDDDDVVMPSSGSAAPSSAPQKITLDDLDDLDNFDFGDEPTAAVPATSGDDGELDLDRQLEMLLMADENADESFEMRDISSALPTQSVYDPEVDGMGSIQYVKGMYVKDSEKQEKLFANISSGKMIATFIIGVLVICVGAVTAIFAHSAVQEQRDYASMLSHFTSVEIPVGVANNANTIFVNERSAVGETSFTLTRISAAYSGTFLYFEENFDPDNYYILLFNQARNLYPRTTFDVNAAQDTGTVLQFGPLSRNTLFLTLHIQCRNSGDFTRFNYRLTSPPVHEGPVFINRSIYVEDSPLVISHAVFDSASSKIHFSYTPDNQVAGLRVSPLAGDSFVALHELGHRLIPHTNEKSVVYFERFGTYVGSASFGPIMSLESTVNVVFSGLSYFYPNPSFSVTPEQLFGNDRTNPFAIQTGLFTLNLEAMAQQGTYVVMPMFGLDENNRRRPTNISITLHASTDDGIISMPGIVRISPGDAVNVGTDVLFDLAPYIVELRDVHVSQYSITIDWVEYEVPTFNAPIRVSEFFDMKSSRRHAAELAVVEAFNDLLSHMSGEISQGSVVGLSPELRDSDALFAQTFAPRNFEGRAMYSASVSTGDLISPYDYLSIVEIVWAAEEDTNLQYIHEVFQVTSRSRDGIWSVVEIIRL
ncbi:MAG: hypothetical protein FWF81_15275 [Defluviitaleaceae bacterium]|nr:hypothetical protein [Defluviitaleaceae bacterium]